jgi:hypothetical protein
VGDAFLFVVSWLWVPAVGWLLFGLPWHERRVKRRHAAERHEFWRAFRVAEIELRYREGGEDYLRRLLVADLVELRNKRQVQEWLDAMMNDELEKLPPHLRRIVRKSYEEVRG